MREKGIRFYATGGFTLEASEYACGIPDESYSIGSRDEVPDIVEDMLSILDVEEAVLSGQITGVEKDDPRGTKYVVMGTALDQQTPVGVVGRFASSGRYLIITVYEVSDFER